MHAELQEIMQGDLLSSSLGPPSATPRPLPSVAAGRPTRRRLRADPTLPSFARTGRVCICVHMCARACAGVSSLPYGPSHAGSQVAAWSASPRSSCLQRRGVARARVGLPEPLLLLAALCAPATVTHASRLGVLLPRP